MKLTETLDQLLTSLQTPENGGNTPTAAPVDPGGPASYEAAIGAAETLDLGFHLGAAVERIVRAAGQGSLGGPALREAHWLIHRYIATLEPRALGAGQPLAADLYALVGDSIAEPEPEGVAQSEPEPTVEPDAVSSEGRIRRLSLDLLA